MATSISVDTPQLPSAAGRLKGFAPEVAALAQPVQQSAQRASMSNMGYFTGDVVTEFADQLEKALDNFQERIEGHADGIEACADSWDDSDSEADSAITGAGSALNP